MKTWFQNRRAKWRRLKQDDKSVVAQNGSKIQETSSSSATKEDSNSDETGEDPEETADKYLNTENGKIPDGDQTATSKLIKDEPVALDYMTAAKQQNGYSAALKVEADNSASPYADPSTSAAVAQSYPYHVADINGYSSSMGEYPDASYAYQQSQQQQTYFTPRVVQQSYQPGLYTEVYGASAPPSGQQAAEGTANEYANATFGGGDGNKSPTSGYSYSENGGQHLSYQPQSTSAVQSPGAAVYSDLRASNTTA